MALIQLSRHHLLSFLKRLRIIVDKFWKLGIRQVPFLKNCARICLSLIIGRFRNLNEISTSSRSRASESIPCDKAIIHYSHGTREFDHDVDCFSRLPISFFSRWPRSQSLPLHYEHHFPDPQTRASTCQAVVPYSVKPVARDDMNMSPLTSSSTSTRAEDHYHGDPPGLSKEISDFVGVTSSEFERYTRNITLYVQVTTESELRKSWILFDIVRNLSIPDSLPCTRSHHCFKWLSRSKLV